METTQYLSVSCFISDLASHYVLPVLPTRGQQENVLYGIRVLVDRCRHGGGRAFHVRQYVEIRDWRWHQN